MATSTPRKPKLGGVGKSVGSKSVGSKASHPSKPTPRLRSSSKQPPAGPRSTSKPTPKSLKEGTSKASTPAKPASLLLLKNVAYKHLDSGLLATVEGSRSHQEKDQEEDEFLVDEWESLQPQDTRDMDDEEKENAGYRDSPSGRDLYQMGHRVVNKLKKYIKASPADDSHPTNPLGLRTVENTGQTESPLRVETPLKMQINETSRIVTGDCSPNPNA